MSDEPRVTENDAAETAAPDAAKSDSEILHGAQRFEGAAEAVATPPGQQAAPAPSPEKRITKPPGESWLMTIQSLLGTIVIALFVITFATQAFQIPSESMENTLLVGD